MRAILFLCLAFLLFSGCSSNKTSEPVASNSEQADLDTLEEIVYSDTIRNFTDVGDFEFNGPSTYDTTITIEGRTYRLHLESELFQNQRVKTVDKFESDGKLYIHTYVGYQGRYRIALYQEEKKLFDRTLKKEDFEDAIYSLVVESDAYLPELIAYNSAFKSLVFHVPFYLSETCWSTNALLVMDLNGKVKFVDGLDVPMGNSSNYFVQFSPSKKHMVSGSGIHHANGKYVDLSKKSSSLMGIDVFSNCLLAVYEYEEGKHDKNAYLVDYEGKKLLNFRYEGWTGGLGYHFPYEKVHGNYYFIDEVNKRLIRLKKGKVWSYQFLPFSSMKEFDGKIRIGEIPFSIQTEIHSYQFYLNAQTNKLRKTTPIEY